MKNREDQRPKIGAGHLAAWLRAGAKEFAQVLPAFPAHGIQPVEEQGLAGNVTNIEVLRGKEQGSVHGMEEAGGRDPIAQARERAQGEINERRQGHDRGMDAGM